MKKFIIATTILLASTAAANAGCGTASLNGTWSLQFIGGANASDYVISGGVINGPGLLNVPISQSTRSCKVTFSTGGTVWTGRSENVRGTLLKPHHVMMTGDTTATMFIMHRK